MMIVAKDDDEAWEKDFEIFGNDVLCVNGVCSFDEIVFQLAPLKSIDVEVWVYESEENSMEKEFEEDPTTFTLYSRTCEAGERLTELG